MTDMQALCWTSKLCGLALVAAVLAPLSTPASAQDDEGSPSTVFREILKGIGLQRDEPGIAYRERSPLVVPPALTLPPPDSKSLAERNPAWPVDQDVRRSREAAEAKANTGFVEPWQQARVLTRDELDRGRGPGTRNSGSGDPYIGQTVSPSALGYVGGLFGGMFGGQKEESKPFTGEPPRTALVQPPAGYQTPAVGQPYGIGKETLPTRTYNSLENQWR